MCSVGIYNIPALIKGAWIKCKCADIPNRCQAHA